MKMKGKGKIYALAFGIVMLILLISEKDYIFVDNESVAHYIMGVMAYVVALGFIGGIIYLIVTDYIRNKMD